MTARTCSVCDVPASFVLWEGPDPDNLTAVDYCPTHIRSFDLPVDTPLGKVTDYVWVTRTQYLAELGQTPVMEAMQCSGCPVKPRMEDQYLASGIDGNRRMVGHTYIFCRSCMVGNDPRTAWWKAEAQWNLRFGRKVAAR